MAKTIDNFAQFKSAVAGFSDELEEQANDFKAMLALKIVQLVTEMSPIDTGLYKGNWLAEINHPDMRELKTPDKDGERTAARATSKIDSAQPGEDIWITNNKVYAPFLEFGTEHMAPRRILGRALALVDQIGKRPRRGLRSAKKLTGRAGRRR